jgi:two-component system, OmpR family, KDP operon response regulator KdpE
VKALIVEDSAEVVETVSLLLGIRWPDCQVITTRIGEDAIRLVGDEAPDILLLDLGLPDQSGLDVLRAVRGFSDTPIIIVSADQAEVDRVKGLELGADDYLVKPFSHTELLARVKAVLRRSHMPQLKRDEGILTVAGLVVDFAERRVVLEGGREVLITPIEWSLLYYLSRNRGRVIPYAALSENVWGTQYVTQSAIKAAVYRLRQKLNDDGKLPRLIRSHPGVGYSLVGPE